mmetsp:Transcript_3146/g.6702  ORF Transcript_3146/g.6702 Transcript_3146/m.6702 type:complete len:88 (+) Transcript_3146:265-528(+)
MEELIPCSFRDSATVTTSGADDRKSDDYAVISWRREFHPPKVCQMWMMTGEVKRMAERRRNPKLKVFLGVYGILFGLLHGENCVRSR